MNTSFSLFRLLSKLLAMVALFVITVFVINTSLFDETLDPAIVQSLKPTSMPNNEDNAYLSLMGFTASSDKDMNRVGQQLTARHQQNLTVRSMDELTQADYKEILGQSDLDETWMALIPNCIARKSIHCSSTLAQQIFSGENNVANSLITNPRIIALKQRYLQISQMVEFQQTQGKTFSSPLPSYAEIMRISQLNQAEAYHSDDFEIFIFNISQDQKLWRLLLLKGDSLLDKMIAIVRIWGNLHTVSDYISKMDSISDQQHLAINALLNPLSAEELDISDAFIWEQAYFYNTLKNADANQLGAIYELPVQATLSLIQINATMNAYHHYFIKPIVKLGQLNSKNFYQKTTKNDDCCFKGIESLVSLSPSSLYNLGGKSILTMTIFNPEDYIARVHDLNGVIQLVKLKLSLKGMDKNELANTIKNSKFVNQYTGEPLNYQTENNKLGFDCLNKGSGCEIEI